MKKLILIRHAKTESPSLSSLDFDRKLKKRGWSDAKLVAEFIQKKGYNPDKIITSPAVRAYQTATVFSNVFDYDILNLDKLQILYDGDSTQSLIDAIVSRAGDESKVLMVIGHNPDVAILAMRLSGERIEKFPTTGAVVINFDVKNWDEVEVGKGYLELFVYPSMLKE